MNKLELVSIMIPTFNQENYIGRAIESAMAQTYSNLEIVISDDASTDQTEGIVNTYLNDPRVKYFRQEKNIGRVNNYRKNLYEQVTGQWVLNLDGDDYLLNNNYISEAMKALDNFDAKDTVLICADRYESDEIEHVIDYNPEYSWTSHNGKDSLLRYFSKDRLFRIWHLTSLYRRDIAMKVGFYHHHIMSSDQESIFRLIMHGDILYSNTKVAVWQVHSSNISKELNKKNTISNLHEYVYVRDYALENNLITPKKIKQWCSRSIRFTVRKYIKGYAKYGGIGYGLKFYSEASSKFMEAIPAIFNIKVLAILILNILQREKGK